MFYSIDRTIGYKATQTEGANSRFEAALEVYNTRADDRADDFETMNNLAYARRADDRSDNHYADMVAAVDEQIAQDDAQDMRRIAEDAQLMYDARHLKIDGREG